MGHITPTIHSSRSFGNLQTGAIKQTYRHILCTCTVLTLSYVNLEGHTTILLQKILADCHFG